MWPWEFLQTPSSLGISPEEAMAEDTRKAGSSHIPVMSPEHSATWTRMLLPLTSVYIIHPLAVLVVLVGSVSLPLAVQNILNKSLY